MKELLTVNVVEPDIWMLTPLDHARVQLALCAYGAGLAHDKVNKLFKVEQYGMEPGMSPNIGLPVELMNEFDEVDIKDYSNAEDLIRRLINMKPEPHESVEEHSAVSFLIRCSRIGSHEIVRHRHMGITQRSTRYCREKDVVTFIKPPHYPDSDLGTYLFSVDENYMLIATDPTDAPDWLASSVYSLVGYQRELDNGVKRESARYLLPHDLLVWIQITPGFRELRSILKLRCNPPAAPEMNKIFRKAHSITKTISPILVEDIPIV